MNRQNFPDSSSKREKNHYHHQTLCTKLCAPAIKWALTDPDSGGLVQDAKSVELASALDMYTEGVWNGDGGGRCVRARRWGKGGGVGRFVVSHPSSIDHQSVQSVRTTGR